MCKLKGENAVSRRRQTGSKGRRSSRMLGAGSAVGAFLAFGMAPLAAAPAANADIDDALVDLFGQGLGDAVANLGANFGDQDAWEVVLDPASWTALYDGLGDSSTWDAVLATDNAGRSVLAVSFYEGRIVGLDAQIGTLRWTIPRIIPGTTEFGTRWLTASSGVIVATSNNPDLIAGYDAATGTQLWRVLSDQGSPFDVPLTSDADLAYVAFSNGVIGAYDLITGKRRWLRHASTGMFSDPPAISHDTLFLGGYDAAYAIRRP